jgi:hypothetical protein
MLAASSILVFISTSSRWSLATCYSAVIFREHVAWVCSVELTSSAFPIDLRRCLRLRHENGDRTPAEGARNLEEAYWAGSLKSTFDVQRPSCCACATHS